MLSLFDNITAMIIAGSVLVIMLAMQQQAQRVAVERTLNYVGTRQSIDLGRWVQEDLANIGAGVAGNQQALDVPRVNAEGLTREFTFQRKLTADAAAPVQVRYTLELVDSVDVRRSGGTETVRLYQLRRVADGHTDGESAPRLTDFKIELLDSRGDEAASAQAARYVRVQFASISHVFRDDDYIHEYHWATTVPLRR